ncbi:MAG: MaoC family dehydratase [Terriglobales bacterium]
MHTSHCHAPVTARYFEDYVPGSVYEYGAIRLDEADIITFAKDFDPQYFHLDREAAAHSPFGGLIASGWHTTCVMMRLMVDHYLSECSCLGSPGVDELRFHLPVRPGDSLSIRVTVVQAHRSRSKPDRGVVRSRVEVLNQNREVVLTMKGTTFMRCRNTS